MYSYSKRFHIGIGKKDPRPKEPTEGITELQLAQLHHFVISFQRYLETHPSFLLALKFDTFNIPEEQWQWHRDSL